MPVLTTPSNCQPDGVKSGYADNLHTLTLWIRMRPQVYVSHSECCGDVIVLQFIRTQYLRAVRKIDKLIIAKVQV